MVIHQSMRDVEGYLTVEQVRSIIEHTINKRDKMLCEFMWLTGRRITEVLRVKKKHIDWHNKKILFTILKKRGETHKWKVVPEKLMQKLIMYCIPFSDEDYIFPSPYIKGNHLSRTQVYRIIREAAEDAGIYKVGSKPVHPHVFRHSFAVHYIKNMKSPKALSLLQSYLEHKDITTTSVYLQFGDDEIEKDLNEIF